MMATDVRARLRSRMAFPVVLTLALLACPSLLRAQFQPPIPLSSNPDGAGGPSAWATGLDHFNNIVLAVVENGELTIHSLSSGGETRRSVAVPGVDAAEAPSLAFTALRTYVAFAAANPESPGDTEVFVASKFGGAISDPERFFSSPLADRDPSIAIHASGRPVVAWTRVGGDGGGETLVGIEGGQPVSFGSGERPRLGLDFRGGIHLLHRAPNGDLSYRVGKIDDGSIEIGPSEDLVRQTDVEVPYHELRVCNGDEVMISYNYADRLFLVRSIDGVLEAPREVVSGEFRDPHFSCNSQGILAASWEREGDLWYRVGSFDLLMPEESAFDSAEAESSPQIILDPYLNLFLTYRRDGKLFFTTNASLPRAEFLAEPTEGEAPLLVRFTDLSEGNILRWHWDFGDGGTSTRRNPEHVYERPGKYTVSLGVEGPGGVNAFVGEREIRVLDPSNTMGLADRRVYPGQPDVYMPLTIKHSQPIQGCQIAFSFDPDHLDLVRIGIDEETNFAAVAPELIIHDFTENEEGRTVVVTAVIIDFEAPYDGRTFQAGAGQRLANLVFNVRPSIGSGIETEVRLQNQIGEPPINNIFISEGQSILPVLRSGVVRTEQPVFPPPRFFIRGDANESRKVDITDVIRTLNFLFLGGEPIRCMDAADANDDGRVNISDAGFLLSYLFLGGNYPPPPFPELGLDTTADRFPDCFGPR